MTDTLNLSNAAVEELMAGAIKRYETTKGVWANTTGNKKLGEILQDHLTEHNVKRNDLAQACDITANYVTKIILGDRMPQPKILARIAGVLGEQFLMDWYHELYILDREERGLNQPVYTVVDGFTILSETYARLVNKCIAVNTKRWGEAKESECHRDVDRLVRQQPAKYGVPSASAE